MEGLEACTYKDMYDKDEHIKETRATLCMSRTPQVYTMAARLSLRHCGIHDCNNDQPHKTEYRQKCELQETNSSAFVIHFLMSSYMGMTVYCIISSGVT